MLSPELTTSLFAEKLRRLDKKSPRGQLDRLLNELPKAATQLLDLLIPLCNLLFHNEPAEAILGRRFEETGAMPAEAWSTVFTPEDGQGCPIPPDDLPLMITLATQRPAYRRFYIRGLDGTVRQVEVAAIPIIGLQGDFLGAAALFWEASK